MGGGGGGEKDGEEGYRNIRLGLTNFIVFKLVLPSTAVDLYGNSNWPVRGIGWLASTYSNYSPYKLT